MSEKLGLQNPIKLGIYALTTFLIVVFLGMTTCAIHSNTYDEARARGEAEKIRAESSLAKIKSEAKIKEIEADQKAKTDEIEAIERLIAKGINPVAARCAVKGWKGDKGGTESSICTVAAALNGNLQKSGAK